MPAELVPAQAGSRRRNPEVSRGNFSYPWIPACAGMTKGRDWIPVTCFRRHMLRGNDTEVTSTTVVIPAQAGIHADESKKFKKIICIYLHYDFNTPLMMKSPSGAVYR